MSKYFNYFPKTVYSTANNLTQTDVVTNITSRFGFEQALKENSSAYYKYSIQDGDTPEIIASKYYGDPEKHWIVLSFNQIIDPQWDWPMDYNTLIKFIDNKYSANGSANATTQSGIAWAMNDNNVYAYFKVVTKSSSSGIVFVEKNQIDSNSYNNLVTSNNAYTLTNGVVRESITKEKQTYFDYEVELNESKREINLLKKDFVAGVEKEFKRVINGR
tara:strand:- start:878 stop:1528 length:651 start_codon:yes stop_codon:yes gene_type:complete